MKSTLYSCLTNVKSLQILTLLLLFLELSCDDLQSTGDNKDLSNVAIWINFRQEMFLPFLYSILLSGPRWGNKLSYSVKIEFSCQKTCYFVDNSREVTEWYWFPEEMHSHRNSDINMIINCEPLTDLWEGTGEEKRREGEGGGGEGKRFCNMKELK